MYVCMCMHTVSGRSSACLLLLSFLFKFSLLLTEPSQLPSQPTGPFCSPTKHADTTEVVQSPSLSSFPLYKRLWEVGVKFK